MAGTIIIPVPTPQQQAQAVLDADRSAAEAPRKECDALYLVGNTWFTAFCQHTGFTYDPERKRVKVVELAQPGSQPGPIDNSDIVDSAPLSRSDLTPEQRGDVVRLRSDRPLLEKRHYFPFHEPAYRLLRDWYGIAPGARELRVEYQPVNRLLEAPTELLHLQVVLQGSARSEVVALAPAATVANLKRRACLSVGADEEEHVMFDFYGHLRGDNLERSSFKTLQGMKLHDEQAVLLVPRGVVLEEESAAEAKASTSPVLMLPAISPKFGSPMRFGTSPLSPHSPLSRSFGSTPSWAEDVVVPAPGRRRGLAGLGNLGNTCFMNSSIQCLTHTLPVMEVFLSGAYKLDINRDNPLSLGGKLATAFADLMTKLWAGGTSSVSPKRFKWQLAQFAPQFSGYAQQDSQELLAFLLDGLHEDLNRIQSKPYIEEKDTDGRPDAEVAAEAWDAYRRRNDSVIVDHFQGLYKSTLTCPSCGHQSVKFDPYMYLSLPLPSAKTRNLLVTALWIDGSSRPVQYGFELPKAAPLGQLYAAVAQACGLVTERPEEVLLLAGYSMDSSTELQLYDDPKAHLSSIVEPRLRFTYGRTSSFTLVAYIYPSVEEGPLSGGVPLQIYHKRGELGLRSASSADVVPPTVLFLPREQLASLELPLDNSHWVLAGEDNPVAAALRRLLRPFAKHPAVEAPAAAAAQSVQPPAELASAADEPEAMDADQPDTPTAAASSAAAASAMEVVADSAVAEGMPADDAPADGAFDMFAKQAVAPLEQADAEAAAALGPPYILKLGKAGRASWAHSSSSSKTLEPEEGGTACLVAEWQAAAQAQYDAAAAQRPEQHPSAAAVEEARQAGGKSVSLADCVEAFLQPEQLDEEDSWFCSKCKQHVQADKKLDLWSLPDTLVVHLKRFSYSRYSRDKLDTVVQFPLLGLDLRRYVLNQQAEGLATCYDLYAVSNHFGGLGGGHYTCFAKMPDDDKWFTFDDSSVHEMVEENVVSSSAYVLFYRRRSGQPAADLQRIFDSTPEGPLAQESIQEGDEEQEEEATMPDASDPVLDGAAGAIELD